MSDKVKEARIVTPVFRVSFPAVFQQEEYLGKKSFGLSMIFPAGTDLGPLKKACQAVALDKWGAEGLAKLVKLGKLKTPFHSGEEKDVEGYDDDCTWANAKCQIKPGIVGPDGKTLIEVESDFYAGCYARATVVPYAYDVEGSKGVALGLRNLQFVRHGEPFAGSSDPTNDFGAVEGANESFDDSDDNEIPF
jgi:hypothetical protein